MSELDVKEIKLRLPYGLRTNHNFPRAEIRVDEDQIHFTLRDESTNVPEIWIYDNEREKWAHLTFLMDSTSDQI